MYLIQHQTVFMKSHSYSLVNCLAITCYSSISSIANFRPCWSSPNQATPCTKKNPSKINHQRYGNGMDVGDMKPSHAVWLYKSWAVPVISLGAYNKTPPRLLRGKKKQAYQLIYKDIFSSGPHDFIYNDRLGAHFVWLGPLWTFQDP